MAKTFKPYSLKKMLKPPSGLFDVSYSALSDGTLAVLRSDCNVLGNWQHNLKKGFQDKEILTKNARGLLFVFDGDMEWPVLEFSLECPFPLFDRFSDGNWILVNSKCSFGEENAVCYTVSGEFSHRFHVGDAVQHIQCDPQNMLWVGYFDEGVFGNRGWDKNGMRASFDITGLLRFNSKGVPLWASPTVMLDCYALNVFQNRCWAYYYSAFDIVEISQDGIEDSWKTDIKGAKALAVFGQHALLVGGYGDDFNRVILLELESDGVKERASFSLNISDKTSYKWPTFYGGRGALIHVISGNEWIRLNVQDVCDWARI